MRSLVLLLALLLGAPSPGPIPATTPVPAAVPAAASAPASAPGPGTSAAPRASLRSALGVLHEWDARRLAAWRAADPVALRALYTTGSGAGAHDVRLLRAYDERGYVVRELRTQVFALRVVRRTPSRLVLRVFDRVAGGVLVRAGAEGPMPSTLPAVRLVELRRVGGRWRVAGTTAVPVPGR